MMSNTYTMSTRVSPMVLADILRHFDSKGLHVQSMSELARVSLTKLRDVMVPASERWITSGDAIDYLEKRGIMVQQGKYARAAQAHEIEVDETAVKETPDYKKKTEAALSMLEESEENEDDNSEANNGA